MIVDQELKAAIRELAEYPLFDVKPSMLNGPPVAINRVILAAREADRWIALTEGRHRAKTGLQHR